MGFSIPAAAPGFHNHCVVPRLPQPPLAVCRELHQSEAMLEPNSSSRAAAEKPAGPGVSDLVTCREDLEEPQGGVVSEQRARPWLQREREAGCGDMWSTGETGCAKDRGEQRPVNSCH